MQEDQLERLRRAFDLFDEDHDGYVACAENSAPMCWGRVEMAVDE